MFLAASKLLILWWPGTESNRRRQPFQGCALPAELPGQESFSLPDSFYFRSSLAASRDASHDERGSAERPRLRPLRAEAIQRLRWAAEVLDRFVARREAACGRSESDVGNKHPLLTIGLIAQHRPIGPRPRRRGRRPGARKVYSCEVASVLGG